MATPESHVIAIDGPSGAGKSTVARLLARRLGYLFLDTGAMYRAVALAIAKEGISLADGPALDRLLERLRVRFSENGERVFLRVGRSPEEDVTAAIRTPEVTSAVSPVAALPAVRRKLTAEQRAAARGRRIVAEGRDTTTVVFPDAAKKFFLTASLEERARRRKAERPELRDVPHSSVVEDIERRDAMDRGRDLAPLREAPDSIRVDTTGLGLDQVIETLAQLCDGAAP